MDPRWAVAGAILAIMVFWILVVTWFARTLKDKP